MRPHVLGRRVLGRFVPWLLLGQAPLALSAQTPASAERATGTGTSAWFTAWSPLAPVADLTRALPRGAPLPDLLRGRWSPTRLAWAVGTPAALAFDVTGSYAELAVGLRGDAGAYRRPLDPDRVGVQQVSALGWRPLGARGGAAGRVVLDQEVDAVAGQGVVLQPYASDPHVITDATDPRMRRLRMQVEGALGWRFGEWGAGLAIGVEVRDHTTRQASQARLAKVATPGLSLGVSRRLPLVGGRLALYARRLGGSETVLVSPQVDPASVYQLDGYNEPDPIVVQQLSAYFRRIERDARLFGEAVTGTALGVRWVAFAEQTRRSDDHTSERREDAPKDTWRAGGSALGFAAESFVAGGLWARVAARRDRLHGDGRRTDLQGIYFKADESVWSLRTEAWLESSGLPVSVAAVFQIQHERRKREDFIVEVASDVEGWTPSVGLEVARAFGRTAISVGSSLAWYAPVASIPDPAAMDSIYRALVTGEQGTYASASRAWTAAVSLRRELRPGTAVLLRWTREALTPRPLATPVPSAPTGDRVLWSFSVAAILTPQPNVLTSAARER